MEARIPHPALHVPGAMAALAALSKSAHTAGLPERTLEMVHLRASQINGCSVCVDMHSKALKGGGETDERLFAVAAWRDAPYYTGAERAALALTECVTRIADRPDPVPDDVWEEATRHFSEPELSALLVAIATINVWNRLNVSIRQVAGAQAAA